MKNGTRLQSRATKLAKHISHLHQGDEVIVGTVWEVENTALQLLQDWCRGRADRSCKVEWVCGARVCKSQVNDVGVVAVVHDVVGADIAMKVSAIMNVAKSGEEVADVLLGRLGRLAILDVVL